MPRPLLVAGGRPGSSVKLRWSGLHSYPSLLDVAYAVSDSP